MLLEKEKNKHRQENRKSAKFVAWSIGIFRRKADYKYDKRFFVRIKKKDF